MQRIRAFERAARRAAREGLATGAVHASIGQEAVALGVCGNLGRSDLLLSNHRGHGHTLAKGADPGAMMRELFGREGGVCGGKGGSMHIADFGVGMLGANGACRKTRRPDRRLDPAEAQRARRRAGTAGILPAFSFTGASSPDLRSAAGGIRAFPGRAVPRSTRSEIRLARIPAAHMPPVRGRGLRRPPHMATFCSPWSAWK